MAAPPYVAGNPVQVRCQNTFGSRPETLTAERQRAATASAHGEALISTIQEAGAAPPGWGWAAVPGAPGLQTATMPGTGRRGPVYAAHQTPPPGPSGTVPTRNSQMVLSSRPFVVPPSQFQSPAVPATQRPMLVVQTDHGTFGSQHTVSGVPALSSVQSQQHWGHLTTLTPPGQLINLSGDFNHDLATSVAAAGLAPLPAPNVRRAPGATHQGGSNLDGFWTSNPAAGAAHSTSGMTGDHLGQEMMDIS